MLWNINSAGSAIVAVDTELLSFFHQHREDKQAQENRYILLTPQYHSIQFSSVAQSCPTLATPWIAARPRSAPGLPGHHQLPEFTQTHVHRVGDAITALAWYKTPLVTHSSPPTLNLPPFPPVFHALWCFQLFLQTISSACKNRSLPLYWETATPASRSRSHFNFS